MVERAVIDEASAPPLVCISTAMLCKDVIHEASASHTRISNAMLGRDMIDGMPLNRDIWVRSCRMHVQLGSTSMPEEGASEGKLHSLQSVSSSQQGASASGPDMCLNTSYASWKGAPPENSQQLPNLSSSTEMTEAGDHQDNVKERSSFASLPMLEQHQIRLEDGSVRTYYALPRDSKTESIERQAREKLTSLYDSLSFPQLTQKEGSLFTATTLREQCIEDVLESHLRPHSELGEAIGSLDPISRKRRSLHIDDDLSEKRLMGLERADHIQFERRVQREMEDLSQSINDGRGHNCSCALPLKPHACAREGTHFHHPHDILHPHDNECAGIEESSEHVHRAYLNYAKVLNEFPEERIKLEKQGKGGTLLCLTCKRFSRPYLDTHSLVMHTYMSRKRGLRAEHLGLRKAICTMMGWSNTLEPSIRKRYQHISLDEAKMNKEDLILWPPALVIHNAVARESSDFQARDAAELAVKDLFKDAGLSSSGIEVVVGNIGSLLVEYSASTSCLLEAEQLHLHLATKGCGRDAWLQKSAARQQESMPKDKRILYGYLACAHDLDLVDRDFRRRCVVLSRKKISAVPSSV